MKRDILFYTCFIAIIVIISLALSISIDCIKLTIHKNCNHEWIYVGHDFSTTAICKKCNVEVERYNINLIKKNKNET